MNKTTLSRTKKHFFDPTLFMLPPLNTQRVLFSAALYSGTVGFSNQLADQKNYTHFSQHLYKYDQGFNTNLTSLFLFN